jgi:hypothetical protein
MDNGNEKSLLIEVPHQMEEEDNINIDEVW